MRCPIHDLAAGPDGRCALCATVERRAAHRRSSRRWRPIARFAVALAAGVFVFAWLLVLFDTRAPPSAPPDAALDAPHAAPAP
jgi:hypothetical protein